MSMLWNERSSKVRTETGGGVFWRVLRAVTIVAIASSCSTIERQESAPDTTVIPAQEPYERPDITSLDPIENESFLEPIINFLQMHGYPDASSVLNMTINFKVGAAEKLAAFKFDGSPVDPPKTYPSGYFVIPEDGANFKQAIVIYTKSPGKVKGCTSGGGTIYC